MLEGLRGEVMIAELCRREGIHPNMYYKDFLEAGKQRLVGDCTLVYGHFLTLRTRAKPSIEECWDLDTESDKTDGERLIPSGPRS